MIMFMSDIWCVTNRKLCEEDFLARIKKITLAGPAGIILREKDLTEKAYKTLAADVMEICKQNDTTCVLHGFVGVARELGCAALHLPFSALSALTDEDKKAFPFWARPAIRFRRQ